MEILLSYQINQTSTLATADRILDIRPAKFNYIDGHVGYVLPKVRGFIRHLGIAAKGDRADIYKQQPPGIWIDGFGYGPMTGRIGKPSGVTEILRGNYDKFPELPRTRKRYERIIEEPPCVERKYFDLLAREAPADKEKLAALMENPDFFEAVSIVFEAAGIRSSLAFAGLALA